MDFKYLATLFMVIGVSSGHQINLVNSCPFSVWPGILGNPGHDSLEGGGFELPQGATHTLNTPDDWAGRIWGRTQCGGDGHCQTGDCGNKIQCAGAGGVPPVTLAEMTFKGAGGLDFYDISLVDGYNLPVKMTPTGGFTNGGGDPRYDCKAAGCNADLNANCPDELAVKAGDATVACKSACLAFNTDEYCCRGSHGTSETCKSSSWPRNYPEIFKQSCPDAYSYAYDDTTSTFTCRPNPATVYEIKFCP